MSILQDERAELPTRAFLRIYGWIILAWLLSNVLLLVTGASWLILPAAAFLYGFLPGFLLVGLLFSRPDTLRWTERLVLSAASSYLLSTLLVLIVHFLPGPLTLAGVLIPLNLGILALLALNISRNRDLPAWQTAPQMQPEDLWPVVVLVALIIFFRFLSLNYSEYQGDEIDVTGLVRLLIAGQGDALFLHRKGPVELLVAASFALFNRNFNEFALRFPFALASGWATLGTYTLARRLLEPRLALLAGGLLAINGIFLGFSRMVQYQGVVTLMLVSAVLCYYLLSRETDPGREPCFGVLGIAFWGFGLLTHYEASLMGLVLILLYLGKRPSPQGRWRSLRPLLIAAGITVLLLAAYYVPFVSHAHFSDTFQRYTQIRISLDRAPFNNLGDYLTSSLFYNSVYYEVVMALGLLIVLLVGLRHGIQMYEQTDERHGIPAATARSALWPWLMWALFAFGVLGGAVVPSWLQVGGFQLSLILVLPALVTLALSHRYPIGFRMLVLWLGVYLIAYAFLIRTPGLHYYTLLPAWAILAAWGLGQVVNWGPSPAWRWAAVPIAIILGALLVYHPYMLFIKTAPEYALTYPQNRNALYWNTSSGLPERFFGLPHRSGWKAIGYLFAQGTLSGDYRSNEKEEIITWYTGAAPSQDERPTYYLVADNATEKEHKQDYPKDLLASAYSEVGTVLVAGGPRLHIYHLLPAQGNLGQYRDEDLAPLYDELTGLNQPAVGKR